MINQTEITLTQSELTTMLILATEFVRRDSQGIHNGDYYRTERTRQIWLTNCNSLMTKADNALNHCLVTNEGIPPINY